MTLPRLFWDAGTAYDLFVSLEVLHHLVNYGLRGAWAAGVRARLAAADRQVLEQSHLLMPVPLHWIYSLPEPKDAAAVLWILGRIPPAERLPVLALAPNGYPDDVVEVLKNVAARGTWNEQDRETLRPTYGCKDEKRPLSSQELAIVLGWWARAPEFGERYLEAMRAYQGVFFAEEEKRIRPMLQGALARAQEMAGRMALPDLLEKLSQGLRFEVPPEGTELALAASYWCTPFMLFGQVSAERRVFLFGARPPDASLIPGEVVPDALLRALQALSDPTRLRILNYLNEKPLTPTELGRRLRLRTPTVMYHLATLRLAGLVQLTLGERQETKNYAIRFEAVEATWAALKDFVEKGGTRTTSD
jgi:DNA-binding transcriptional ArsR family regulator